MGKFKCVLFFVAMVVCMQSKSQSVQITKGQLMALTPEWKGERFADGRPKVPDNIIRRMKSVSVEEAWLSIELIMVHQKTFYI